MSIAIENARVLLPDGSIRRSSAIIDGARLAEIGARQPADHRVEADGLLLLPGIVDLHGDAFERQIMPRPGVQVPLDVALADTDRQMVANGITTAYHGITCSWEPGLRSTETCRDILAALARLKPSLACDTRAHIRFETYNLDAVDEVVGWVRGGHVGILAFNDHTPEMFEHRHNPLKTVKYLERSGLIHESFVTMIEHLQGRRAEVAGAVGGLAQAAGGAGVPLMSHDDEDEEMRRRYHSLGCAIAEFPKSMAAAEAARELGNAIVMGAPNVMRGGSHNGGICAASLIEARLCGILASDYYYPSLLLAAFRLAENGIGGLGETWRLVSANPARAVGLADRGEIDEGKRADLILVDDRIPGQPQVVGTFVAGRLGHMSQGFRFEQRRAELTGPPLS
jgi:alpha-D-ribose 1-methylphosphonate 5-triphosphate diphosphatase